MTGVGADRQNQPNAERFTQAPQATPDRATHDPPPATQPPATKYYQLTHDYLVPALRDWLTRKQKETRRGRAELLLADRATVWSVRPENRQLPSLLQWLQIRWHTAKRTWTLPQREMMAKASRYHVWRGFVVAVLLALVGWGVYEGHGTLKAHALRDRLLDAHINEVPSIVEDMLPYRRWLDPLLHDAYAQAEKDRDRRKQLHASLALLPVDASLVKYLKDRLLDAEAGEVAVLREALMPHKDQLIGELWLLVEAPQKGKEGQRLRASAALAKYDPESAKWAEASVLVVTDLVRENPVHLLYWTEAFRPVRGPLLEPLSQVFRDHRPERAAARSLATNLLADYAADKPQTLANLLLDADDTQFVAIYVKLRENGEKGSSLLTAEIDKKLPGDLPASDTRRETLAKRQAHAALALFRSGQTEKVWPLFKRSPPDDPRVRSYLIHRLGPLGADAGAIIRRLEEEADITIRRALLLSLGEFSEGQLPADARVALLPKLRAIYSEDKDPGFHAAVEWLLRQWKKANWLKQTKEEWAKDKVKGEGWWAVGKGHDATSATRHEPPTTPRWYVNSQGQTMVVIPGPVEFLMGSPPTEDDREGVESEHTRRIGRTFALAATPVTVREFRRFLKDNKLEAWFEARGQAGPLVKVYSPDENGPIILVDWYRAAAYCNWLSQQDGIPEDQWCYETNARKLSQEKMSAFASLLFSHHPLSRAANMNYLSALLDQQPQVAALKEGYLGLRGYRLPTEAEMEYACRAGALTSRYYGETEELLAKYAWYEKNSKRQAWPVGVKMPNDFGLFDMHGNVFNWCQETYKGDYAVPRGGGAIEDKEDSLLMVSGNYRAIRGGSFPNHGGAIRAAFRDGYVPWRRVNNVGIRPARTFGINPSSRTPG